MKKRWMLTTAVCTLGIVLVGCSSPTGDDDGVPEDLSGRVVTIEGPFLGDDAENFRRSLEGFEDDTGIDVQYTPVSDFESQVGERVSAADAPDIAVFPQPGLLEELASRGEIQDLDAWFSDSFLTGQYEQTWLDLAAFGGLQVAGIWYRASVKSLVWYNTTVFDAEGYQIPQDWDELLALSAKMVSDGYRPWTIGIESGEATGWTATDWIEDVMLRLHPVSDYDEWVDGTLNFDSRQVREAIAKVDEIWTSSNWVLQTPAEITTTHFGDAPDAIVGDSPSALMHRQASFITGFFPENGEEVGQTVDAFYLPPITTTSNGNGTRPILGAGDIAAAVADRPEVRVVMEHLASAASAEHWIRQGGFISPHKDIDTAWYPTLVEQRAGEFLSEADVFRFDGSDLMPGPVGTDAFWSEITSYVAGDQTLDTTLSNIDDAWQ